MKKYIIFLLSVIIWLGCTNTPLDEDNLLITERAACYVGSFELLGVDYQTVRSKAAVVDTVAQTITVEVLYGTNLKSLYPQFSLVTDAKLEPKVTGFVDFSDLVNPRKYTVISGNRKVKKEYEIKITVQQK